ncbi:MAG: hypothetical protein VB078_04435 [Clostridiaceae bacterium]|nr:hypothetical protein [Clostridiaceae bacterium]
MKILKLFPSDPYLIPDEPNRQKVMSYIRRLFPLCKIADGSCTLPQFVDCADSLENVICPICGADIDCDDWSCLMDELYTEDGFASLKIITPCCGERSSLDKLIYKDSCGFSCYEIDIEEPPEIPADLISGLKNASGIDFCFIGAEMRP